MIQRHIQANWHINVGGIRKEEKKKTKSGSSSNIHTENSIFLG